uniref:Coiled-coil protein 142 C-terminal domain-containing protein n=1 Tax=Stomoxys calcitrans TaxID=35570 RepID=A0A1I8PN77_STOCA
MSSTPKWYCRNKSQPMQTFAELSKLGNELRRITKRLVIDVKVDIFTEHDSLLEECERIVEQYWSLKDQSNNKEFQSLSKKIKRSPYNALLMQKFRTIIAVNDRRFCQLTFVLKKTVCYLLKKSLQSEVWLSWALQITQLYNKCRKPLLVEDVGDNGEAKKSADEQLNANICSNMYPALLLPYKSIDFPYVLQLAAQQRIEQNSLDLMFGLFNMGDQEAWRDNTASESNCSSLEILRILTLNLTGDGEFQQYLNDNNRDYAALALDPEGARSCSASAQRGSTVTLRSKHIEYFLQTERSFVAQFIQKAFDICPTIFGHSNHEDLHEYVLKGMRLMWSYVGIILDHIILWWIDTPISCYSLTHVDSIRSWLYLANVKDIPEPVYSTLQGIGEILTNFVSNNLWDRLFRLTLISATAQRRTLELFLEQYKQSPKNQFGTPTGTVWIAIFTNLINLSNNYFQNSDFSNSSLLPVSEQIPILHRIDHSVHCMRLWVKEEAKRLCNEWKMDRFFQILEHDVKLCLQAFVNFKLPKLTADLTDILMLVCVALRTKLICEINANIDKLKKTTDECVQVLSDVCRLLSLANFTLCFPSGSYWQRNSYDNEKSSEYVGHVLDQILLPCIKATKDVVILKLIMKIICEAWLDHIYQKHIRFSVNGAVRLLNDFDDVREWILSCSLLEQIHLDKLSNHEVLRMCKGVGKILLRKPEDIIAISQSPTFEKKTAEEDAAPQETQLPSEMFVSNQKNWLQLRANKSNFLFFPMCCGDTSM